MQAQGCFAGMERVEVKIFILSVLFLVLLVGRGNTKEYEYAWFRHFLSGPIDHESKREVVKEIERRREAGWELVALVSMHHEWLYRREIKAGRK